MRQGPISITHECKMGRIFGPKQNDSALKCPKCDRRITHFSCESPLVPMPWISTTYCNSITCEEAGEHLHQECWRCGYWWRKEVAR